MLYSSVVALALYGAVLGASNSVPQSLLSAAKLPLLFLMTPAICLPTLYLFNLVFGARLQVKQALALVLSLARGRSSLAGREVPDLPPDRGHLPHGHRPLHRRPVLRPRRHVAGAYPPVTCRHEH